MGKYKAIDETTTGTHSKQKEGAIALETSHPYLLHLLFFSPLEVLNLLSKAVDRIFTKPADVFCLQQREQTGPATKNAYTRLARIYVAERPRKPSKWHPASPMCSS